MQSVHLYLTMPRSRSSRSSSPLKHVSVESRQVQKQRDELLQQIKEMFSSLDIEIIYNVLSECQWEGEEAIDKLLTLCKDTPKQKSKLHEIAEGLFGPFTSEEPGSHDGMKGSSLSECDKVIRRPIQPSTSSNNTHSNEPSISEEIHAFSAHFTDYDNSTQVDKIEMDLNFPYLTSPTGSSSNPARSMDLYQSRYSEHKSIPTSTQSKYDQLKSSYSQQFDDAEGAQHWETCKQEAIEGYLKDLSKPKCESNTTASSAVRESDDINKASRESNLPTIRNFPVRLLSQSSEDCNQHLDETEVSNSLELDETVQKVISELHEDFRNSKRLKVKTICREPQGEFLSGSPDSQQSGSFGAQSKSSVLVSGTQMTLPVIGLSAEAAEFVPRASKNLSDKETGPKPDEELLASSLTLGQANGDNDDKVPAIKCTSSKESMSMSAPVISSPLTVIAHPPVSIGPALSPVLRAVSPVLQAPNAIIGSPVIYSQPVGPMFITPKWPRQSMSMAGTIPHLNMTTFPLPGMQMPYGGRMVFAANTPVFHVPTGARMPTMPTLGQSAQGPHQEPDGTVKTTTKHSDLVNSSHIDGCVQLIKALHQEGKKVMVIVRGLPGSGKSCLSRALRLDGVVLSTDDYFMKNGVYEFSQDKLQEAHQWNQNKAKDAIRQQISPIIIDNTNTQAWEFKTYVNMAVNNGYHVQIMEPNTPWKFNAAELARRNTHGVPKAHIEKMLSRFERDVKVERLIKPNNKQPEAHSRQNNQSTQEPTIKDSGITVTPNADDSKQGIVKGSVESQPNTPVRRGASSGSAFSPTSSIASSSSVRSSPIPTQVSRSCSPLVVNFMPAPKETSARQTDFESKINLVSNRRVDTQSTTSERLCVYVKTGKQFEDRVNKVKSKLGADGVSLVEELVIELVGEKKLNQSELLRIEEELKAYILLSALSSSEIPVAEELISLLIHGVKLEYVEEDNSISSELDSETGFKVPKGEICVRTAHEQTSEESSALVFENDNHSATVVSSHSKSSLGRELIISTFAQTQSNQMENAQLSHANTSLDNIEQTYWGKSLEPTSTIWATDLEMQDWEKNEGESSQTSANGSNKDSVKGQRQRRKNRKYVNAGAEKVSTTNVINKFTYNGNDTQNSTVSKHELKKTSRIPSYVNEKSENENDVKKSCMELDLLSKHDKGLTMSSIDESTANGTTHGGGIQVTDQGSSAGDKASIVTKYGPGVASDAFNVVPNENVTDIVPDNASSTDANTARVATKSSENGSSQNGSDHSVPGSEGNQMTKVGAKEKKKKDKRKIAVQFLKQNDKDLFSSKDWNVLPSQTDVLLKTPPLSNTKIEFLNQTTMTTAEDFSTFNKLNNGDFVNSNVKVKTGKIPSKLILHSDNTSTAKSHLVINRIAKIHTNDKSTATDEQELLSAKDGLMFLRTCFPDVSEVELECVLENCDGNVDWTIEMLLSWEYSTPLTNEEKRDFIESMAQVRRGFGSKPVTVVLGNNIQQPMGLLDLCFDVVEQQNIASREEVEQQLLVTCKGRLHRIEDEHRLHGARKGSQSRAMSELDEEECSRSFERQQSLHRALSLPDGESTAVDINWSVLEELSMDLDDSMLSPENIQLENIFDKHSMRDTDVTLKDASKRNEIQVQKRVSDSEQRGIKDTATPSKINQRVSQSTYHQRIDAYVRDVSDASVTTDSDAKTAVFTMVLSESVISNLENLYGPIGINFKGGEGVPVPIDHEMSWALYQSLQQAAQQQQQHLHYQLIQDEKFARQLQAEEDRVREQSSSHGPSTVSTHPSLTKVQSLSEIMEEEQRAQTSQEQFQQMVESEGGHLVIATVLKRNKLYDKYPNIDRSLLDNIFQLHCFNLSETIAAIDTMLREDEPFVDTANKPSVDTANPVEDFDLQQIEAAKKLSVQVMLDQYLYQPVVTKDFQDGLDPVYEDLRGEANLHYRLRHECFQKAKEAFRRGLKEVASFYSQQGHAHTKKIKEANMRASEQILQERRLDIDKNHVLDLHGFHADEAVAAVDKVIAEKEMERQKNLTIITGRGSHSRGGVSKLRPTIMAYLQRLQYRYTEPNPGVFKVSLKLRIPDTETFQYSGSH